MYNTDSEEVNCGFMSMLSWSQSCLHTSTDLEGAILVLLITVLFNFATNPIAPTTLAAALCQGRKANIQMDTKQWRAIPVWRGGFIIITWERLRSIPSFILAKLVLTSQEVQDGVHAFVCLVNSLLVSLQGSPPVSSLGLLLAPESCGQERDEEGGRQRPSVQRRTPQVPRAHKVGAPPRSPQAALSSSPKLGSMTLCTHAESLQSFLTLCNPMDHSPPVSFVQEILQAWKLEWVAMPFSRRSSKIGIEPRSLMSPAVACGIFDPHPCVLPGWRLVLTTSTGLPPGRRSHCTVFLNSVSE